MQLFDRVEIPAYEKHWLNGDRYGLVIRVPAVKRVQGLRVAQHGRVKLDSGKIVSVMLADCRLVEGAA